MRIYERGNFISLVMKEEAFEFVLMKKVAVIQFKRILLIRYQLS